MVRRALELKAKAPGEFLRVVPELTAEAGRWAGAETNRVCGFGLAVVGGDGRTADGPAGNGGTADANAQQPTLNVQRPTERRTGEKDDEKGDDDVAVPQNRKPKTEDRRPDRVDRLEALATLFELLLEFEARDEAWRRYRVGLTRWLEQAGPEERAARKAAFWARCPLGQSHPVMTREQVAALHHAYFSTVLRVCEAAEAVEEARSFAKMRMTSRPHLARAALRALKEHLERQGAADGLTAFSADSLFAWAQCHRQLGRHTVAARAFESFLERFPDHPLASAAIEKLRFERRAAAREMKLRSPEAMVAPAAGRRE